jgi:hypothetical protein
LESAAVQGEIGRPDQDSSSFLVMDPQHDHRKSHKGRLARDNLGAQPQSLDKRPSVHPTDRYGTPAALLVSQWRSTISLTLQEPYSA